MIAADTVILMLLTAIVFVVGLILWRAAEAKTYDPDAVDHSVSYDPKHDHFGPDHAKKFQQTAKTTPKAASHAVPHAVPHAVAAKAATQAVTSSEEPWDAHLIRTEPVQLKQAELSVEESAEERERRAESDRRSDTDRRAQERRTTVTRRAVPANS